MAMLSVAIAARLFSVALDFPPSARDAGAPCACSGRLVHPQEAFLHVSATLQQLWDGREDVSGLETCDHKAGRNV